MALLVPAAMPAKADQIELKLAFFTAQDTDTFNYGVKPFVDAINREGSGLLHVTVFADGALGKTLAEQPSMVLEGTADIAWVVPGQTPYRFPDNQLIEMPGIFRDLREGTLAYTRLVAAGALRGYQDFFVIAAYTSAPSIIHSRRPIQSLAALKGQKIRTNNPMEAAVLERFGALPTIIPASKLADAIDRGAVDGAVVSPTGLFQFGAARTARNHYLLGIGAAPLVVVMNRKKFESLPEPAQALIRKYSGERAAAAWIESFGAAEKASLRKIATDEQRMVVEPSQGDAAAAQQVFRSMIDAWAGESAHNRELLRLLEAELMAVRSAQ
ncbi:MAG TPA: TRAP transporter substrate-binding protein DctP [Pseudolabrys sp.]|nr:TRAP transporter substrate-binding protein DctP [Pseudolabrys sp.]